MTDAFAIPLKEAPEISALLKVLQTPGAEPLQREYNALLEYVDTITTQYNTILTRLDTLQDKLGNSAGKKGPFSVMADRLDTLALDVGAKLKDIRDGVRTFTENALNAVKAKGMSALGAMFGALHVSGGLQTLSNGLAKSVAALNKAVIRAENLETFHMERVTPRQAVEAFPINEVAVSTNADEPQNASLASLIGDMRLDFENLPPQELRNTYQKLLSIGMNNNLTANENTCLSSLVDEIGELFPEHTEQEPAHEAEAVEGQDAEI